jgi:DNA-binding protein H-NS
MANLRTNTTMNKEELTQKELLQAKHRKEAIEARDRKKEEKARTRRLIQMGAILANVFPEAKTMDLEDLKLFLSCKLNI